MGRLATQSMIEEAGYYKALQWHLTGNHFPPIHLDFLEPAKEAIELVRAENGEKQIELPNGKIKTAWEIVEGLRLEDFLIEEE